MILRAVILVVIFSVGSVTAAQLSIHSMVVGKKALELSESRQITYGPELVLAAAISPDGKRVAYISEKENTISFCIARTNGTSATAVISSAYYYNSADRPAEGETWNFNTQIPWSSQIAWSPDSKHIAIPATKNTWNPTSNTEQSCILILAYNGAYESTLMPPQSYSKIDSPSFSPNSNKLVTAVSGGQQEQPEIAVVVYDVSSKSGQVVYSQPYALVEFDKWDSDEQSMRAFVFDNNGYHYSRIPLNGQPSEIISERHKINTISPNDKLQILSKKPGIVVENISTGDATTVVTGNDLSFISWIPDNRTLLCHRKEKIYDKPNNRTRPLDTLWLVNVEATKMNTMCVALDYDGKTPTWSTDCTRMAYTCNERLYIAELNRRELTTKEKIAAGIATEEEEKALLLAGAKMLGIGFQLYTNNRDGAYPDEAKVIEALTSILPNGDLFYKPGTDQLIFKYIAPGVKESEIYDFSNTVIGELDLGRSWKVVIYTDAHARVVYK